MLATCAFKQYAPFSHPARKLMSIYCCLSFNCSLSLSCFSLKVTEFLLTTVIQCLLFFFFFFLLFSCFSFALLPCCCVVLSSSSSVPHIILRHLPSCIHLNLHPYTAAAVKCGNVILFLSQVTCYLEMHAYFLVVFLFFSSSSLLFSRLISCTIQFIAAPSLCLISLSPSPPGKLHAIETLTSQFTECSTHNRQGHMSLVTRYKQSTDCTQKILLKRLKPHSTVNCFIDSLFVTDARCRFTCNSCSRWMDEKNYQLNSNFNTCLLLFLLNRFRCLCYWDTLSLAAACCFILLFHEPGLATCRNTCITIGPSKQQLHSLPFRWNMVHQVSECVCAYAFNLNYFTGREMKRWLCTLLVKKHVSKPTLENKLLARVETCYPHGDRTPSSSSSSSSPLLPIHISVYMIIQGFLTTAILIFLNCRGDHEQQDYSWHHFWCSNLLHLSVCMCVGRE